MPRWLIVLLVAGMGITGCSRSRDASPTPQKPASPSPAASTEANVPTDVPATTAAAPDAGAPARSPQEEAAEAPAIDREALARCYTAVYCAQKKGEMSRILSIYKEFGFETPQAFTKAWIEAAKDTEWVTRMAYDVSKKCP